MAYYHRVNPAVPAVPVVQPAPTPVDDGRPRVGISSKQVLELLQETAPAAGNLQNNNVSLIKSLENRNKAIAVVAAVVVAVALTALYIFVMAYFLLAAPYKMVPNPSYGNPKCPGAPEFIRDNLGDVAAGAMGLALGIFILPPGFGFATYYSVKAALDRKTIKPLRDARDQLDVKYGKSEDKKLEQDEINTLLKLTENVGKKALLKEMTFDQLTVAKEVIGERKFRRLINEFNHDECSQWKSIIDFGRKNKAKQETALDPDKGNQYFLKMVDSNPEIKRQIKERLKTEKVFPNLATSKDIVAPVGEDKENDFTVKVGGKEFKFPKEWIIRKSGMIKDLLTETDTSEVEIPKVPPSSNIQFSNEDIIECLLILKGEQKIKDIQDLDYLAQVANYLQLNDLVLEIGKEMFIRYVQKKVTKGELLSFLEKRIDLTTTEAQELRQKILAKINITKVNDLTQFKELWPLSNRLSEFKPMCLEFFKSLLVNQRIFREVYAIAKELKSEELEKVCCDFLAAADIKYKNFVKELYSEERIPDNVLAALENKITN